MKHRYLLILLFSILLNQFLFSQDLQLIDDFGRNKGGLKAYLYIPKNIDYSSKIPLVVVLHGCNQTAKSVSNASGWNKFADSLNFIVLYPEQRQINNINKCFNFFISFKAKKDKGESASIKSMIFYTMENYNIDKESIFITGMSAGGGMANAVLNSYPYLFKAGVLIESPSTLVDNLNLTSPNIPKIGIIQGSKDKVVRPINADKLVHQWTLKNKIDSSNYKITKNYLQNKRLSLFEYYNSSNKLKVSKLLINNVGHRLCIDPGEDLKHGGKKGIFTIDIDFYSTYWIAGFFGLIK